MRPKQLFLLVLCGAIYGSTYVLVKDVIGVIGVITLAAVRTLIAGIGLTVFCRLRKIRPLGVPIRRTIILGVLSATVPYTFLAWSTQLTNAGTASVVNSLVPVFTLLIAVGLGLMKATSRSWWGLFISLVGVIVVAEERQPQLGMELAIGIVTGLIGSAAFAYSAIYARKHFSNAPVLRVALSQQLVAVVTLAPLVILSHPATFPDFQQLIILCVLGVFSTAAVQVLFFWLISEVGAVRTSYVNYLVPVFGILWGWVFLSEPVPSLSIVGLLTVLIGLWLLLTPKKESDLSTASHY